MSQNNQNYNVFPIPLTTAGTRKLQMFTGVLRLVRAIDSAGAVALGTLVEVRLGDNEGDWIPLSYGNAVFGVGEEELTIRWDAQAGVTATFFRSANPAIADVDADPAAQLILGDLSTTQTPGTDLAILTGTTQSIAANADRKECFIQADGELRLSGVTGKGFLWDGSPMYISATSAIDFFNDTAGTVNVTFTEFGT